MVDNIIYNLVKRVTGETKHMPDKYRKEFTEVITEINLRRTKIFCNILLVLDAILLFVDFKYYKLSWDSIGGYRVLFRSHIVILIFFSMYIYFTRIKNQSLRLKRLQCRLFILVTLGWSAFLAVNAQYIHGQVSAYIIANVCLACGYILTRREGFIIFTLTYIYTIAGILIVGQNFQELMGNLINLTFTFVLSCYISKVNYDQYVKIFKDQKTILKQTEELKKSKNNLEELVKVRTVELFKTNELLIEEINVRQEAEIESFKARLLYEEKARLLDETKEYEKSRSNFFTNISHEIRTPVNIIYSAMQMMEFMIRGEKTEDSGTKTRKYMSIIKQNCFKLIRLVGNLIDITKIDAKFFELSLQNCDIVKIVESVTSSVTEYVENRKINLIFDTQIEEKIIACDPAVIERIILNLLSNALKFTPEDGFIYVRVGNESEKVTISVRDTGVGISEAKKSNIFERFRQTGGPLDTAALGSGIGLCLVRALVEMHNGTIHLISECNKGSEFIIELPNILLEESGNEVAVSEYIDTNNIDKINIEFSDISS